MAMPFGRWGPWSSPLLDARPPSRAGPARSFRSSPRRRPLFPCAVFQDTAVAGCLAAATDEAAPSGSSPHLPSASPHRIAPTRRHVLIGSPQTRELRARVDSSHSPGEWPLGRRPLGPRAIRAHEPGVELQQRPFEWAVIFGAQLLHVARFLARLDAEIDRNVLRPDLLRAVLDRGGAAVEIGQRARRPRNDPAARRDTVIRVIGLLHAAGTDHLISSCV